jgi:DNA-directed RNA polymerase subunit RPC12/RpoP
MDARTAENPNCPSCGNRMVFFKAVPAVASLPALRTYKCEQCGVPVTKTEQDPPQKRANKKAEY